MCGCVSDRLAYVAGSFSLRRTGYHPILMTSITSASVQQKNSGKGTSLRPLGGGSAPHNTANASAQRALQPDSQSQLEGRSEYGSSAVGDSAPVVSSFDDPEDVGSTPQLGYKDELEVRFIWDRVIESNNKEGYQDRVVIDRYDCFAQIPCFVLDTCCWTQSGVVTDEQLACVTHRLIPQCTVSKVAQNSVMATGTRTLNMYAGSLRSLPYQNPCLRTLPQSRRLRPIWHA